MSLSFWMYGFQLAWLIALRFVISPCLTLRCHVCLGGTSTPCYSDPKSTQWLDCDQRDSKKVAYKWYKFMYEEERPSRDTCLALTYRDDYHYRISLRACFPDFNETCEVFEETMIQYKLEFFHCRTCVVDFCNGCGGGRTDSRQLTLTVVIVVMLILFNTHLSRFKEINFWTRNIVDVYWPSTSSNHTFEEAPYGFRNSKWRGSIPKR